MINVILNVYFFKAFIHAMTVMFKHVYRIKCRWMKSSRRPRMMERRKMERRKLRQRSWR